MQPTNLVHNIDTYQARVDTQFNKLITDITNLKHLVRSLKLLQFIKPSKIEFIDTGFYARCDIWNKKLCTCDSKIEGMHWDGNPEQASILLKVPVSSFTEVLYNKGRFWCWRWGLKVVTEKNFMEELQHRPELIYDVFTYPVKVDYLSPVSTQAAIYRWLKLYCPNLDYKFELVQRCIDSDRLRRIE